MNGKLNILRRAVVACGDCGEQRSILDVSYNEARLQLRLAGWADTKKKGWLCPKCHRDHITTQTVASKSFYGRFKKKGIDFVKCKDGVIRKIGKVVRR